MSANASVEPEKMQKVLLVVDVQVNQLGPPAQGGVPNAAEIRSAVERVLSAARAAQPPPQIIHVRNNGEPGEPDEPGTEGWPLVFPPLAHEPVVDKWENDSFKGTQLGELVPTDATLVVIGMQSNYCIRATCRGARARGNKVLLVKGAHAACDAQGTDAVVPAAQVEAAIEIELEKEGVVIIAQDDVQKLFSDASAKEQ